MSEFHRSWNWTEELNGDKFVEAKDTWLQHKKEMKRTEFLRKGRGKNAFAFLLTSSVQTQWQSQLCRYTSTAQYLAEGLMAEYSLFLLTSLQRLRGWLKSRRASFRRDPGGGAGEQFEVNYKQEWHLADKGRNRGRVAYS